jgi:hypothetical protein
MVTTLIVFVIGHMTQWVYRGPNGHIVGSSMASCDEEGLGWPCK